MQNYFETYEKVFRSDILPADAGNIFFAECGNVHANA